MWMYVAAAMHASSAPHPLYPPVPPLGLFLDPKAALLTWRVPCPSPCMTPSLPGTPLVGETYLGRPRHRSPRLEAQMGNRAEFLEQTP